MEAVLAALEALPPACLKEALLNNSSNHLEAASQIRMGPTVRFIPLRCNSCEPKSWPTGFWLEISLFLRRLRWRCRGAGTKLADQVGRHPQAQVVVQVDPRPSHLRCLPQDRTLAAVPAAQCQDLLKETSL